MASRLINVRLDEEHLRKVGVLREHGVAVSELVREAIDARYEEVLPARKPLDVDAIYKAMFEKNPTPPDAPKRDYNVHDRHEAREAILKHLRRKR